MTGICCLGVTLVLMIAWKIPNLSITFYNYTHFENLNPAIEGLDERKASTVLYDQYSRQIIKTHPHLPPNFTFTTAVMDSNTMGSNKRNTQSFKPPPKKTIGSIPQDSYIKTFIKASFAPPPDSSQYSRDIHFTKPFSKRAIEILQQDFYFIEKSASASEIKKLANQIKETHTYSKVEEYLYFLKKIN